MFSIEIPHRFFQIHPFIAEIKPRVSVNLSWNRCGIHIDHRQFSCATSVKFSLLWKLYGYATLNLLAIQRNSTQISDWIHTDSLCCLQVYILRWKLHQLTVRIQPAISVELLLITCRFNVSFPVNFHCCEKNRETPH